MVQLYLSLRKGQNKRNNFENKLTKKNNFGKLKKLKEMNFEN